jgi:hypothetical protein
MTREHPHLFDYAASRDHPEERARALSVLEETAMTNELHGCDPLVHEAMREAIETLVNELPRGMRVNGVLLVRPEGGGMHTFSTMMPARDVIALLREQADLMEKRLRDGGVDVIDALLHDAAGHA